MRLTQPKMPGVQSDESQHYHPVNFTSIVYILLIYILLLLIGVFGRSKPQEMKLRFSSQSDSANTAMRSDID